MYVAAGSDQSRSLVLTSANSSIKQRIAVLTREVTTGRQDDMARVLGGNTHSLSTLQHRLTLLDTYRQNTTEAAARLEATQTALATMNDIAERMGPELLGIAAQTDLSMAAVLGEATTNLDHIMSAINANWAGTFLFSGASPSSPAITSPSELMASIIPVVSGLTTAEDVVAAVDDFFAAPVGGGGYLDTVVTGSLVPGGPISITPDESVAIGITVDRDAIRTLLSGSVLAVLAQQGMPALKFDETTSLVEVSGMRLLNASDGLTELRAQQGVLEANVERARLRNETERTSIEMAYNTIVAADPFQASVALSDAQSRLETLYAIIARLSRMSLADRL